MQSFPLHALVLHVCLTFQLLSPLAFAAPITRRERKYAVTLDAAATANAVSQDEPPSLSQELSSKPSQADEWMEQYKSVEELKDPPQVAPSAGPLGRKSTEDSLSDQTSELVPLMSHKELGLLVEALQKATNYLEFGMGGSSHLASRMKNIEYIHGVESSSGWINRLRETPDIAKAIKANRLRIVNTKTGSTTSSQHIGGGYPTVDRKFWPNYSGDAATEGEPEDRYFDTVFVDGRFRVACFLRQLQRDPRFDTTYLIHDYQRKEYHVLEDYATLVKQAGRMALFTKRSDIDFKALNDTIAEYIYEAY